MSQNLGLKMAMRPSPADHLMRQREKAQQERAKLIKKNQEKQNQPRNVGFPQLRRTTEKDDRIEQLLGPHSAIVNSLSRDTDLLGVISQPQTPLPSRFGEDDFFYNKPANDGRNGIRPNHPIQNFKKKPPSKPQEPSKNSQNLKQPLPVQNADHSTSKSLSHQEPTQNQQPKSENMQIKKEIPVLPKAKKVTKSSQPKSPHSSSSDHEATSNKSTPSPKPSNEKPKPLGNSTKQFTPPNGVNRPPRKNLEKLTIPSGQNEVHKETQSVDDIFKEMTHLELPLTAISTPQKDEHFPFPNSVIGRSFCELKNLQSKLSKCPIITNDFKKDDLELDIPLVAPIEPLITPPETPIKPPLAAKQEKNDDIILRDLTVSDDSEDEVEKELIEPIKISECPPRKDTRDNKAPVKEPRSPMSSDSSSSESGNDSDSSSDDSNSSSNSDDDEEEEKDQVRVDRVKSPSKSPAHDKSSNSTSWKLENFLPGDKCPKPSPIVSDHSDDNKELLDKICLEFIHKSPTNSIEKSPNEQLHSDTSSSSSSSSGGSSPQSIHSPAESIPSKSPLVNGIAPTKKISLHSDNSDSEIDVVNTPQKKVSLMPQSDSGVAKCLNFADPNKSTSGRLSSPHKPTLARLMSPKKPTSGRQSSPNKPISGRLSSKRLSSGSGSIIGLVSSDEEDENDGPRNNNNMELNLQDIIDSVGTKHTPLSPIHQEPEKVPPKSPCLKTTVNKDALKFNDGKPSIVVRLNFKNVEHLIKNRIKKSPYRDKVGIKCEELKQKSPYPIIKSPDHKHDKFIDETANTEPQEMDLDTDSEMANVHIEDYSSKNVSSYSSSPLNDKCWKPSDKISIKRKENAPEKVFTKRRKITPKTNNKSTETAQQEKDSHEDDHKWDRKRPLRSTESKGPLSNSSSSSHTDKPEFELVEDLNGQANSDAHPSSVETIFNREGDGDHETFSRKPVRKPDEPLESSDIHRSRARDLKHQADELAKRLKHHPDFTDRIAMYLLYTESMSSFVLCGYAMEKEERKATDVYKMYSDTFNLISHICKIRPSAETSETEKKLAVLIYRIQSILCFKLYKMKKNEALKFKKIIDEHNKTSSSKQPAHAPSPHWNNRSTPSPMSPSPSPAGSDGSIRSQDSGYTPSKLPNGNISTQPTMSSPGTVAVPQRIHSITQQYHSIVNYVVQCHEFWDQAESVYSDQKVVEFYGDIDDQCGSLTLHSSVPDLVYYVQIGLQKIKET